MVLLPAVPCLLQMHGVPTPHPALRSPQLQDHVRPRSTALSLCSLKGGVHEPGLPGPRSRVDPSGSQQGSSDAPGLRRKTSSWEGPEKSFVVPCPGLSSHILTPRCLQASVNTCSPESLLGGLSTNPGPLDQGY